MTPRLLLLALTALSVNLEVALLVAALATAQLPLTSSFTLAAFHGGYLIAPALIRVTPMHLAVAALGSIAVMFGLLNAGNWAVAPIFVTLSSASIQALRRQLKGHGPRPTQSKGVAKVIAMCMAGLAFSDAGLGLLVAVWSAILVVVAFVNPPVSLNPAAGLPAVGVRRWLLATEFFHHAHYFAYCYMFWWVLPIPASAVGALFVVGWLAYFCAEHLFRRSAAFSLRAIALGHLVCVASLTAMVIVSGTEVAMVLWFLTGVGGGTAYMLSNGPQTNGREFAEDTGHVTGTLVGGLLAAFGSIEASLVGAAGLALMTAVAAGWAGVTLLGGTPTSPTPSTRCPSARSQGRHTCA